MDLNGKVALITGGSRGVGAATALQLAKRGCHVAINCNRTADRAKQVAEQCQANGVRAAVVQGDVAADADCRRIVVETIDALGQLDILVNNAGTTRFIDFQNLDDVKDEDWDDILSVNLKGPFQCARAARAALLALAAPLSVLAGCYAADFDDEADGVFACTEDADCRDGFVCLNALCLDDRGPALTVLGPESLSAFDAGTDTVEISFRGSDLTLSNNFETAVDGEGYLEIYLDGQPVRSKDAGTAITEGDLAGGISVGALDIPDPSEVNHRVEIRAFRGDGTRYDNPSATGRQVFFVRSDALIMAASRPMMAVTRPWPGDRIKVGAPITVEIAAVDFTWADPTGEAGPGTSRRVTPTCSWDATTTPRASRAATACTPPP